jgi:ATP adenylyltransferase
LKTGITLQKVAVLVSPLRHTPSFFEFGASEQRACFLLIEQAKERRNHAYRLATVTGFNVGINDGIDAGQTIMHCHIHHLIPRRNGDVADPPRGEG